MRLIARAALIGLIVALVATGCSMGGGESEGRVIKAHFTRAVQVFPGNSVRVLGVTVGRVTNVQNTDEDVVVTMRIDDPNIELPADVKATIIPVSLLGERYVQMFPAYQGGAKFTGGELSLENTSVPVEQDELFRSLQDYFGELDPEKVEAFVTDTANVLRGNGETLNQLIDNATGVVTTLDAKKDSLADLIVELNTLTQTLSTRQQSLTSLINTYNEVSHALNDDRAALEGTIDGLSAASVQLADLLSAHHDPLNSDIDSLTRTTRTLQRNVGAFVRTGHHATRLFGAASRAMDFKREWLRLGNQGKPLVELLTFRLRDRLVGVCLRLELDECSTHGFWANRMPDLFCLKGSCPKGETPADRLKETFDNLPEDVGDPIEKEIRKRIMKRNCAKAEHPRRCRLKKKAVKEGIPLDEIDDLIDDAADGIGDQLGLGGT
jgi:phospholipid/cholesterol/gamma-HCH transport system substrate-binding protein